MSNRNFDSRVIIQRLQEQNYSRNLYTYNTAGNQIIRNPQNSNGAASRFTSYTEGSQTMYFRGLVGGGVTSSIGGTFGNPLPTDVIVSSITPSTIVLRGWATNIGGTSSDVGNGIANDINGNVYVSGYIANSSFINSYSTLSSGTIITSRFGQLVSRGSIDAFIAKYNSAGVAQWATNIGGTNFDYGYRIATGNNNVYTIGYFSGTSFINSYSTLSSGTIITSTFGRLIGNGTDDVFIAKYNSAGVAQWATNIGGVGYDYGYGIATDINENVYVTGLVNTFYSSFINSYSTLSSGTIITSTFGTLIGNGSTDAFIAKYNSSGVAQWATNIGGTNFDYGYGIATDINENIYVTGYIANSSFINSYSTLSSGTIITSTFGQLVGRGNNDVFIAKYNSAGVAQWATNIGGTGSDVGREVVTDIDGNVYVTGSFTNSSFINSYSTVSSGTIITSTFGTLIGNGSTDAFIAKYNSSGEAQWATNIGGTGSDVGREVVTDIEGNVYVTGSFTNSSFINMYSTVSSGTIITSTFGQLVGRGSTDAFIAKYNSSGVAQWATNIGGSGNDIGYGISTDINGNVYVTGSFTSSSFINMYSTVSSGTIVTSTFGQLVGNGLEAFIVKYNTNGQM
jgi:hypothetical protein